MKRGWQQVGLVLASCSLLTMIACSQAAVLRGKINGLNTDAENAEKNGAMRCAPRELALAKSHLRFAAVELDQGELSNAEHHMQIAEPNAHAALALSPPEKCAERRFVEARPGDRDGDGYPDNADKCPDNPETWNGFEDEDGCPDDPDTDKDNIPDSRDQCVLEPEDVDGYLDDDGCPDPDNDSDGIPDGADKCPMKPEDMDGFQDDDGCPDPDNDGDTVLDVDDFCPNTPGQPGGKRPGCPGLVVVTAKEIRITQQIHFEFNKATIRPESFPILDAVVQVLNDNPKITLEIQGHTDNVGGQAYNQKLSESRAASVRQYLAAHGIDPNRLISKGYGLAQPIVPNSTAANRALNRRVQFIRTEAPAPTPP
jgi:OOP family OmpA-OmpF porin